MSELLQLLTMAPHPVVGARFVGDRQFDEKSVFCSMCRNEELTIADFYMLASGRRASWCKECTKAYNRGAKRAKKAA